MNRVQSDFPLAFDFTNVFNDMTMSNNDRVAWCYLFLFIKNVYRNNTNGDHVPVEKYIDHLVRVAAKQHGHPVKKFLALTKDVFDDNLTAYNRTVKFTEENLAAIVKKAYNFNNYSHSLVPHPSDKNKCYLYYRSKLYGPVDWTSYTPIRFDTYVKTEHSHEAIDLFDRHFENQVIPTFAQMIVLGSKLLSRDFGLSVGGHIDRLLIAREEAKQKLSTSLFGTILSVVAHSAIEVKIDDLKDKIDPKNHVCEKWTVSERYKKALHNLTDEKYKPVDPYSIGEWE